MDIFNTIYHKYLSLNKSYLDWDRIKLVNEDILTDINELQKRNNINNKSNKVCVIKLNGGLGTTMGCQGPKSLIKINDDFTFMDIIIEQHKLNPKIPLVLMNSFFTHHDTLNYLDQKNINLNNIFTFSQNKYPRILKETNKPLVSIYNDVSSSNIDYFYPPGHGDLLQSLNNNNILDTLINRGIEYAFVSNSDNLGATINFDILNDLIMNNIDFAIELTKKTSHDVKGGTLIKYNDKFMMFEIAQCPPNKLKEFMSIEKFKYFNTNNIWIKLSSIKKLLNTDYMKDIDIIVNNKKLQDGRECIQLEYAIGSLVKFFDKVKCYVVDRDRFIPVKTNTDLENIKSNDYILDKTNWRLIKNHHHHH